MTRTTIVIAAGLALAVTLPAASAQAQSIRTFVSTAGTDNPSCSLASPCRHFSAAVAATLAGGEVDALDAGAYGSFTISHAISIEGQGWSYVAPPTNGAAITINALAGDKVVIRGVSLNGVGATGNTIGIEFNTGGSLNVQNSVIQNFTNSGIGFFPNASSSLFVSDTLLADSGIGLQIGPTGSGTVTAVLNRVEADNNIPVDGLSITGAFGSGGSITATVSESIISGNTNGIDVNSTSGQAVTKVTVFHSVVANSQFNGVTANGANATVTLAQSSVAGNAGSGWNIAAGGVVQTYQDNYFNGNGPNSGSLSNVGKQ
jgi:hypothetical protein